MATDETVRFDKDYSTKSDGVYYRLSKKNHKGKPDKTFKIRYRINGVSKNESIGVYLPIKCHRSPIRWER